MLYLSVLLSFKYCLNFVAPREVDDNLISPSTVGKELPDTQQDLPINISQPSSSHTLDESINIQSAFPGTSRSIIQLPIRMKSIDLKIKKLLRDIY
jgi:hypothetical protein